MPRDNDSLFHDKYSKVGVRIAYGAAICSIIFSGLIIYGIKKNMPKERTPITPSQIERITTEPARVLEEK
jgi:hypothetical protein